MSSESRLRLIERIEAYGMPHFGDPLPLVTLEEFFSGNDDFGSIGCNLSPLLGPRLFYEKLKEIRARPNVKDVLVEINEVVPEDSETWPFSDRVYIFTDASPDEVSRWAATLRPDTIEEGFANGKHRQAPDFEPGVRTYALWWD
jgi:hypothetical protein